MRPFAARFARKWRENSFVSVLGGKGGKMALERLPGAMVGFRGRVVVGIFEPGGSGRGEFILRTDGVEAPCFCVVYYVINFIRLKLYYKIV